MLHINLTVIIISIFVSCVDSAVLSASILTPTQPCLETKTDSRLSPANTDPARLELREKEVQSVCGYWSDQVSTHTIGCSSGIPCLFEQVASTVAVGYCSDGSLPITAAFDNGSWHSGGCSWGEICCPAGSPKFGIYLFNSGSSGILRCAATSFSISATTALLESTISTTGGSPQSTQTQASGSSGSGGLGKSATIALIVGIISGVVTITGGIFAILKYCTKHQKTSPPTTPASPSSREALPPAFLNLKKNSSQTGPIHIHFHQPVNAVFNDCQIHLPTGVGGQRAVLNSPRTSTRALVGRSRLLEIEGGD